MEGHLWVDAMRIATSPPLHGGCDGDLMQRRKEIVIGGLFTAAREEITTKMSSTRDALKASLQKSVPLPTWPVVAFCAALLNALLCL